MLVERRALEQDNQKIGKIRREIRLTLPEDYHFFDELINIVACYNPMIEYKNNSLIIGLYNNQYVEVIEKELQTVISAHQ